MSSPAYLVHASLQSSSNSMKPRWRASSSACLQIKSGMSDGPMTNPFRWHKADGCDLARRCLRRHTGSAPPRCESPHLPASFIAVHVPSSRPTPDTRHYPARRTRCRRFTLSQHPPACQPVTANRAPARPRRRRVCAAGPGSTREGRQAQHGTGMRAQAGAAARLATEPLPRPRSRLHAALQDGRAPGAPPHTPASERRPNRSPSLTPPRARKHCSKGRTSGPRIRPEPP